MTDEFEEEWEPREQAAWVPKTPRDEREPLNSAPLATLRATPGSDKAFLLIGDLAERYPRPQSAKGKGYARKKTLAPYANAGGAFVAELLAAVELTEARAGSGAHVGGATTTGARMFHGRCSTVLVRHGLRRD